MQRLQLNLDEKLTRKEYLKRKKKQAKKLKKVSKISYLIIAFFIVLSIYVATQFYVYSKSNNFKYVAGEDVSVSCTSIYDSVDGHNIIFLADESREEGGTLKLVDK